MGVVVTTNSEINSIFDLHHKRIGVVVDDPLYISKNGIKDLLNEYKIESSFIEYQDYDDLVADLEDKKKLDAGVVNNLFYDDKLRNSKIRELDIIFNPLSLFTVSFQLSFVTVGGIIYLAPHLEGKLHKLPSWLTRPVAVSLAAQLSILPLIAFYFNRLPLIGVVTNLLIAPLITIILALGFLTLGVGMVTIEGAKILANTNWVTLAALLKVVKFFSFPQSRFLSYLACPYVRPFPSWLFFLYYSALILMPHFTKIKKPDEGKENEKLSTNRRETMAGD